MFGCTSYDTSMMVLIGEVFCKILTCVLPFRRIKMTQKSIGRSEHPPPNRLMGVAAGRRLSASASRQCQVPCPACTSTPLVPLIVLPGICLSCVYIDWLSCKHASTVNCSAVLWTPVQGGWTYRSEPLHANHMLA